MVDSNVGPALPPDLLGKPSEAHDVSVHTASVAAYAAATDDPVSAHLAGEAAPALFGVVPAAFTSNEVLRMVVTDEMFTRLVHAGQDNHVSRPFVVGEELRVWGEPVSYRYDRTGTNYRFVVHTETPDGENVQSAYITVFLRGVGGGEDAGPDTPSHTLDREARQARIANVTVHVDQDQAIRYAAASGDLNPIHLDPLAAASVGFRGPILHGMCTMALSANAALGAGGGDHAAVRRVAARFLRPVYLDSDIVVSAYDGGEAHGRRVVLFEAVSRGKRVLGDGRLELAV